MNSAITHQQRAWQLRILVSTYVAYGGYYLTRKAFTICKTSIGDQFGWDLHSVAHIWTVYLLAYAIGQFVNSFLGRRFGPRVLLLTGFGLTIAFNTVFGFANSYATFMTFMFFNGLAQASGWPGCVGGVAEWLSPKERGTIMGFWSTNYLIGNMAVKFVGGLLLAQYGWRYAFFGLSAISFLVWWLVYFWQRNRPEDVGLAPIVTERSRDDRAIRAAEEVRIPWQAYFRIALNPVILSMGASYFCIKFLRYALDSWLPAFLNLQGMDVGQASYFSAIFDWAGLGGAVIAGLVLDRVFKGNWAALCFVLGLGMIGGYLAVIFLGASPILVALCFGIVGFMIYGPDTILAGAAAVSVAGERNGVAVAGLVNGIASVGPIFQEEIIGFLMRGDVESGIRNTNSLFLGVSITFVLLMIVMMWRLHLAHKAHAAADAAADAAG